MKKKPLTMPHRQPEDARLRVAIEDIAPRINCGRFAVKRIVGEPLVVTADLFSDGHATLKAALLFRHEEESEWTRTPMHALGNDRWEGQFTPQTTGTYYYTVESQVDPLLTWIDDTQRKVADGQTPHNAIKVGLELLVQLRKRLPAKQRARIDAAIKQIDPEDPDSSLQIIKELGLTYPDPDGATRHKPPFKLLVDRERALFGSWYELFPRSAGKGLQHGTLRDVATRLPYIADLGFDIVYLPPIHPIGMSARKGKNNSPIAKSDDVGSPWAIGAHSGGHSSIHPELGSLDDFRLLVQKAKEAGLELALDIAFQCSPDHPFVDTHPEWFKWRSDGTIQYAENPPKKYEDIVPFHFQTESWSSLWDELKGVFEFWLAEGVRIFRVDNPHTKPFSFWEWVIREIKQKDPDVIFLAEAFTRPKVMHYLAKLGFSQSYTYFTWRNTKQELMNYVRELTSPPSRDYFRPNFWPNTPDILPEPLQCGSEGAFISRLTLAATLSSSYGIYGPAYEHCLGESLQGREEYANSEKYEIKDWSASSSPNIEAFVRKINTIRCASPSLQTPWNVQFLETDNDQLIAYVKRSAHSSEILIIVVNLDPFHRQSGWLSVPLNLCGIRPDRPYLVCDLLDDQRYVWTGETAYVELTPPTRCAHILRLERETRREADLDYFL